MKKYGNRKSETYTKITRDLMNNSKIVLNNPEDSSFIADEDNDSFKRKNIESKSVTIFHNKRISSDSNFIKFQRSSFHNKDNCNTFIFNKNNFNFGNKKEFLNNIEEDLEPSSNNIKNIININKSNKSNKSSNISKNSKNSKYKNSEKSKDSKNSKNDKKIVKVN